MAMDHAPSMSIKTASISPIKHKRRQHLLDDSNPRKLYISIPRSPNLAKLPPTMPLRTHISPDHRYVTPVIARIRRGKGDGTHLIPMEGGHEGCVPIMIGSMPAFPRVECMIHVFEPRYRDLLRLTTNRSVKCIAFCLGRKPSTTNTMPFHEYGTMLKLTRNEVLPEGRVVIEAVGTYRFRVSRYEFKEGYHIGDIEQVIDDNNGDDSSSISSTTSHQIVPELRLSPSSSPTTRTTPCFLPSHMHQRVPWTQRMMLPPRSPISAAASPPPLPKHQSTKHQTEISAKQLVECLVFHVFQTFAHRSIVIPKSALEDYVAFIWWVANVIPVLNEDKITLLAMRNMKQRVMTLLTWAEAV